MNNSIMTKYRTFKFTVENIKIKLETVKYTSCCNHLQFCNLHIIKKKICFNHYNKTIKNNYNNRLRIFKTNTNSYKIIERRIFQWRSNDRKHNR